MIRRMIDRAALRLFLLTLLCLHGKTASAEVMPPSRLLNLDAAIHLALLAQTEQSGQKPHAIQGTVVNSVTGEPIYRALVQIGGQAGTLTDHEGHFEFEGLTTSGIPPFAMKPGYFPENDSQGFQFSSSIGTSSGLAETGSQPIIVKLIPEATLAGIVTGQDGAPLEGIPVQLKMLAVTDGLLRWRQRQGTTTNSEGQYRFADLEAGRYAVSTGFHTEGLANSQSSIAYVPVRNPPAAATEGAGTATGSGAAIAVQPGDHREANLTPGMEKLYPVTGTVSGYGESRGVSFRIETAEGEEISPVSHFAARTGEFRLMLPGGAYQVIATAYLSRGPEQARREITVAQAPVGGITFAMEPYASISVDLELNPVAQTSQGQNNAQSPEDAGANISLTSASGSGYSPYLQAQSLHHRGDDAASGAQGPLTIENVSPGHYVLQATPSGQWYVASASCGGVDLMREELAIAGGAAGCSIRVVLRNDPGSVSVTVRDSSSQLSGASTQQDFLYLLPVGDLVRRELTSTPAAAGAAGFQSVAPGRYLVLAADHKLDIAYRDPQELRRYAAAGQEITVSPAGKTDAEVSLIHGDQ